MEILTFATIKDLGGWAAFIGLLIFIFVRYTTGAIVTKKNHQETISSYKDQILATEKVSEARIGEAIAREKDSKETAAIMLRANTELLRQNGLLAGELKIVGKTMYAINPDLSEEDRV